MILLVEVVRFTWYGFKFNPELNRFIACGSIVDWNCEGDIIEANKHSYNFNVRLFSPILLLDFSNWLISATILYIKMLSIVTQ